MTQNWPTRYRCKKCTRSTSNYPFGCDNPECPIKNDFKNDLMWEIKYFIPLLLSFLLIMLCSGLATWYGFMYIAGR